MGKKQKRKRVGAGPFIFPDLSNLFSHLSFLSLITTISVLHFALCGKQSHRNTKEVILRRRSHRGIPPPPPLSHPPHSYRENFEKYFEALLGIAKMKFQHSVQQEITWHALLSSCLTLAVPVFDLELALELSRCQQNLDWINNHKSLND